MNRIKIMMWDNKYGTYSTPVECDATVHNSRFDKMKSNYESENGAYEVSLIDDSETIDFFYTEDIDFI
jgi:hypothetical protein